MKSRYAILRDYIKTPLQLHLYATDKCIAFAIIIEASFEVSVFLAGIIVIPAENRKNRDH